MTHRKFGFCYAWAPLGIAFLVTPSAASDDIYDWALKHKNKPFPTGKSLFSIHK